MDCVATCRQCSEKSEFTVDVNDIIYEAPEVTTGHLPNGTVFFRQPNNMDLAAVAESHDIEDARLRLARRCITEPSDPRSVSKDRIIEIGDAIREQDPQVEMYFNVVCAFCEGSNSVLFDVVTFVWGEVTRFAQRVLDEVHVLARAYGWGEQEILNMTPQRRNYYLGLISG